MSTQVELNSDLAPPLPLRRFSVAQYRQLGELGVLTPEDNVELLEGWIVEKMNQRPIHGFIVGLLTEFMQQHLPNGFIVRCQLPISTERSEPEPDLAIVRGTHSGFRDRHPGGSDCRLIVEVADTSLEKDRSKTAIYREAGVQEYWIINVNAKALERYDLTQPSEEATVFTPDSQITTLLGDSELTLDLKPVFA